jgi:hypothetical protein
MNIDLITSTIYLRNKLKLTLKYLRSIEKIELSLSTIMISLQNNDPSHLCMFSLNIL